MKSIQIFHTTSGNTADQTLLDAAGDLAWAQQQGLRIERIDIAQQAEALADHPAAKTYLDSAGAEALPLVLVDGAVTLVGRYPGRSEFARWAGLPTLRPKEEGGSCCGECC
ncbi:arsenic metallochaperone ArsD family protein [Pseudothauera nasutitermitis]|uniref:Arsenic metallochaperone ArsD family protein n=1 Tax=Pseudothauera nasutitermitis TaxID=2565930 RepID=A0A4S4B3R8_9RHOO|nr:arsenic metallochaperone ArsD family protein [Pseudothauera nasutitermitis]THF66901.1 arsenic metallochaperone ArsD family protein [Pseudothauera nasutitermitis]